MTSCYRAHVTLIKLSKIEAINGAFPYLALYLPYTQQAFQFPFHCICESQRFGFPQCEPG